MTIPEQAVEADERHYLGAILLRLKTLYDLTKEPHVREQISDEVDWVEARLAALPLMGVQRPEDVARAICISWVGTADPENKKCSCEYYRPDLGPSCPRVLQAARAVLALPHTGQAGEGWPPEYDRYIPDIVKNAMLTAWNEICSDTEHHPTDIEHNFEGRRGHLGFTPAHWASLTGKFVTETLKRASSPPPPVAESGWQPVLKFARRAAFLGAHINDREDGADILARELHRLYDELTDLDGGEEPDLTFCCACREEIEIANRPIATGNRQDG